MAEYTRTDRVLLEIKGVNLSYGPNVILRDVNARITDVVAPGKTIGQVVAFLGPSGIGKTQLSRIVAGLQAPTSGEVVLGNGEHTHKGGVGMVPQNYCLFDYLTVKGNLEVAGRQTGLTNFDIDDPKTKMNHLVEALGLRQHLGKFPCELSGGTRQRVAIAQQFMCADHYLVMDEPFSGLDPVAKRAAGDLIVELSDLHEDNVIIFVTHDIQSIRYADTVWLMGLENGQPGARVVETYDLAALGLCWEPGVERKPDFTELVHHIEDRFATLR